MSRFKESSSEDMDAGIDMSPLIDCVFILLIFFIVTTVFVEETGIEVDKPQAATASQLEKNSILIALSEKGEVIYGKRNNRARRRSSGRHAPAPAGAGHPGDHPARTRRHRRAS